MKRRTFFLGTLASVVYVACGSDEGDAPAPPAPSDDAGASPDGSPAPDAGSPARPTSPAPESHKVFPQGLGSGDPRPDRVVLWTRVEPTVIGKGVTEDIALEYIIAKDPELKEIIARGPITALASADHTVRLVPMGLPSGTTFHYRFELPAGTTTQVGRTKTAPDPSADVPVKFVMAACQDFIGRYYHSWRAFLAEGVDVDFIMFLGDYIYESVNDPRFQSTAPDRAIKLPDGIDTSAKQDKSRIAAGTLADYRMLYKSYRSDELLREVHRLFPFIITWDDHEYADDCWQDHSTSFNGATPNPLTGQDDDEKNPTRRTVANRAFFEYQALDVVYKPNLSFPFDLKIYRQLSWGKHVDIFMTDQRQYRADHLIAEGPANPAVNKLINNTSVGSRYFVGKAGFDPREAAVKPTMLGDEQKGWFLDAVKKSKATWKVWGNEVQIYEMALDLGRLAGLPALIQYTVYVNADQWDGYRSERAEILGQLAAANVENLLVCTGDIHSFWAAELHVDFAAPGPKPIGVEYVTAGISSASLQALMGKLIPEGSALRPVVDSWAGGANKALKDTNPHLKYADSNSYGYALVAIEAAKTEVTFYELGDPTLTNYGGVIGKKRFVTYAGTNKVTQL